MQDRQCESGGFTRTGLRLTDHVVAGHDDRDRLLLNGRRLFVASGDNGCEDIWMKFKSGEAAEFLGHGSASSASAKTHAPKAARAVYDPKVTLAALSAGICENV